MPAAAPLFPRAWPGRPAPGGQQGPVSPLNKGQCAASSPAAHTGMCLPQHSSAGRQVPGAESRGDSSGDGRPSPARRVGQSGCCLQGCARWRPRVPREGTRPLCCERRSSRLPFSFPPNTSTSAKGLRIQPAPRRVARPWVWSWAPGAQSSPLPCFRANDQSHTHGGRCAHGSEAAPRGAAHSQGGCSPGCSTRWPLCTRGCSPGRCTRQSRLLPGTRHTRPGRLLPRTWHTAIEAAPRGAPLAVPGGSCCVPCDANSS